jgi:hypothetical protein
LTHTYDDMTLDELRRRVDDWAHYGIEPSTPREWYIARRARRDAILDLQEALDAEGLVVVPEEQWHLLERFAATALPLLTAEYGSIGGAALSARVFGFARDYDHG